MAAPWPPLADGGSPERAPETTSSNEPCTRSLWRLRPPASRSTHVPRRQPVTLDAVSAHWRLVFDAAQDALLAARACGSSLAFPRRSCERARAARPGTGGDRPAARRDRPRRARPAAPPALSPSATRRMLGLPEDVLGCVFDVEGVLAGSAKIHAAAWAETFDELLLRRFERRGERFGPFRPFDPRDRLLRAHPRQAAPGRGPRLPRRAAGSGFPRGIPTTSPAPRPSTGSRTQERSVAPAARPRGRGGVRGRQQYLEGAREAGLRCAVVSASANTRAILERAGLAALIDECVDGNTIVAERLRSTPEPDTLLAACRLLDVPPQRAAAYETSLAGVEAGRAADLGFVIAVDRRGRADTLREHGADRVVTDLTVLLDPTVLRPVTRDHRLVLLRHGESVWNDQGLFTGWVDVGLSERGDDEALLAGRAARRAGPPARRRPHLGARPRDQDGRDRARGGRPAVDPGPALVAAERAPLRRPPGQEQGADPARVRRRAVHALAPLLRRAAAAAPAELRARRRARPALRRRCRPMPCRDRSA